MNESYFDNLSDVEIRQQLKHYGLTCVPVTETTRNLLIKRLKNHVLPSSSKSPKTRRSAQATLNTAAAAARKTSPGRRQNPSPARRQTTTAAASAVYSNNNNNNYHQEYPLSSISLAASTPSPNNIYVGTNRRSQEYDQGFLSGRRPLSARQSVTYVDAAAAPHVRYSSVNGTPPSSTTTTKTSPKIYVPPPIMAADMQTATSNLPPLHSDYHRMSREPERTTSATAMLRNGRESPGVVSVVNRLLKLRDITIKRPPPPPPPTTTTTTQNISAATKRYSNNHYYLSDSDSDNGSPTRLSATYLQANKRRSNVATVTKNLCSRLNLKGKFKQSSVPYLLISCLGLFFLILAILYMTKPPDMPSTMLEKSTSFTLCEELQQMSMLSRPSINCIDNDLIVAALTLNKELIQLLQTNTEAHYCKDNAVSPEISGTDFMKHLYKKRTTDAHKLLKSFHAALYLIEHNPQWKIEILNKPENRELLPDIYKQDIRFLLVKPYLPLKCILFNKMQRFFIIIGTVFLIALMLGVIFVIWRFVQQRRNMRLAAVDNFTKEIVKELIQKASIRDDPAEGEIIVNHLRDKLIPLNKRKSLLAPWNEALCSLENSDSRIQFGCILQNGEEFKTMKWVENMHSTSGNALNTSAANSQHDIAATGGGADDRPKKKQWQSLAIDNGNKIFDPPTPCLKIRHMFDASEANLPDLKHSITESILEKVGAACRIYDIQLDRQSCCVYIRCATERDAGIVHNEINGWWFDKHLVSIKFLRLQRYLVRFPNSTSTLPITLKNSK